MKLFRNWKREYQQLAKIHDIYCKQIESENCATCCHSEQSLTKKTKLICTEPGCPCFGRITDPDFCCRGYRQNDI